MVSPFAKPAAHIFREQSCLGKISTIIFETGEVILGVHSTAIVLTELKDNKMAANTIWLLPILQSGVRLLGQLLACYLLAIARPMCVVLHARQLVHPIGDRSEKWLHFATTCMEPVD